MNNLIKFEFYKLTKSKIFKLVLLFCVAFCVIEIGADLININIIENDVLTKQMYVDASILPKVSMESSATYILDLSGQTKLLSAFNSISLLIIIAVFVSVDICAEFSTGCIKNIVSRGFPRYMIYLSKLVSNILVTFVLIITKIGFITIASSVLWGFGDFNPNLIINMIGYILIQTLIYFALISFCTMVAFMLRNSSISVAVCISAVTVFPLVLSSLNLLFKNEFDISFYWINGMIIKCSSLSIPSIDMNIIILIGTIYCIVTTSIGYLSFNKVSI